MEGLNLLDYLKDKAKANVRTGSHIIHTHANTWYLRERHILTHASWQGRVSIEETVEFGQQIANGMCYITSKGVIHRYDQTQSVHHHTMLTASTETLPPAT